MPLTILILGSGHGLGSLCRWRSALVFHPELLLLDVRYVRRPSSGTSGSRYFEARFLLPSSASLSLSQVLPPTNSAWQLTSWSARMGDRESWQMSGRDGAGGGVVQEILSITKPGLT